MRGSLYKREKRERKEVNKKKNPKPSQIKKMEKAECITEGRKVN